MRVVFYLALLASFLVGMGASAATDLAPAATFPPSLESYGESGPSVFATLRERAAAEPLNIAATGIFLLAILHTFLASKFMHIAHRWRDEHAERIREEGGTAESKSQENAKDDVSFRAEIMHFLGEVEVVFGIWVIPLLLVIFLTKGWPTAEHYVNHGVNFTEPMFVVVIMAMAATRPVLRFAEQCLSAVARIGRRTVGAWWLAILTVGPLLGSVITEPAAMTICALLLARQFYELKPTTNLRYATLGLLFVNISVGGTLTHFAAPPVLMVAAKWKWDMGFMFTHFGWKAVVGILLANGIYFAVFRRQLAALCHPPLENAPAKFWEERTDPVPRWITAVHLGFLGWTVFSAHYPVLFVGGFLFFLAFSIATDHHQNPLNLKAPLLVGFFLAGLVIHGGLQSWWIQPVLTSFGATALMFGGMTLTAVNDNAAITYLATLVPSFGEAMRYAIVAGAVAGGGLTVIANAPNPAGQSILGPYFEDGVSPLKLFLGALLPTGVMMFCFLVL